MVVRTARCGCGALRVEARGEPVMVLVCHCTECQRRTGSAFGIGAYYPRDQVSIAGAAKSFVRDCPEGRKMHNSFCPECGTTLYWRSELLPETLGIAVGAFNNPHFPTPTQSVWEESRLRWVAMPDAIPGRRQGRRSDFAR